MARFAFRIDVNPLESSPVAVLAKLTAFADDVTCLGYPYPLASAHRMVILATEEGVMLRRQVQKLVMQKGYSLGDWESIFFDYHEYLS
jgi:hypothetical protein